jgi:hypothetical protein
MGLQPTRGALLAPVKTREGEVVAGRAGGSARAASRAGTAAAVVRRAARARRGGASPVPVPVPVPVSAFVGVVAATAVAAAARPSAVAATAITTAVASTRHSCIHGREDGERCVEGVKTENAERANEEGANALEPFS